MYSYMALDDSAVASESAAGLNEMLDLFDSEDLGLPPIPRLLRTALRARDYWCFASRDIETGLMYGCQEYPIEVVSKDTGNYVAVSHGGHGLNSYAISYHLVYGRLALFAQTLWGGAYGDAAAASARVAAQLQRCAELIETYEAYAAADLLPPAPARLIVIESDLREGGICRWLSQPLGDRDSAAEWLQASMQATEPAIDVAHFLLAQPDAARVRADPGMPTSFRESPTGWAGDVSCFRPELQPLVAQVLDEHRELPRPGTDAYPAWVTGCLGDPRADVWFIAENPSVSTALRANAGADATVEDQWLTSRGDKLFRQMLVKYGFKDNEWDTPGGWRCYITDVVKSAYIVKEFNAKRPAERNEIATWWAPVLAEELAIGNPKLIVTMGRRAQRLLSHVQDLLPELPQACEYIHHYVYIMEFPEAGVRGGHPDRIAAWERRFADIQRHPARGHLPAS